MGFALLPLERPHHCFYRIAVSHALLFAFSPAYCKAARESAVPSACEFVRSKSLSTPRIQAF
jgi:hypothetical protein